MLDETYIVFSSDNGYSLGEHRFIGKDVLTDEALQVPLLVRGPGIAPGLDVATCRSRWSTSRPPSRR